MYRHTDLEIEEISDAEKEETNISEGEEDDDAKEEDNDDAEEENNDGHDIYVRNDAEEMDDSEFIVDIEVIDDKMNRTFQNPSQSDKTKNDNKVFEAPTYKCDMCKFKSVWKY